MYGTLFKPCSSGSEDKVGGTFYITMVKILSCTCHTGIYRILMTEQTAVDKREAVAFGMQCHGLSQSGGVVFDGDVLEGDVAPLHLDRIGAECAHGFACFGQTHVGMVVPCDDGVLNILAAYFYIGEPRGHDEFLLVGASFDEYHLMIVHKCSAHLYGIIDIAELSRSVACHDECVRIVVFACGSGCQ